MEVEEVGESQYVWRNISADNQDDATAFDQVLVWPS